MPKEREDVEAKSSGSPEVYQQTKFMTWFEKAFPWLLVGGAALGLVLMIFLPVIFFQEKTAEQLLAQSNLRLALLYTTGGAIAALGLLETYRKNTNDRTKANADINAALKNQEHQTKVLKEQIRQFDDNAFKERKAERRERYTKAVEQLGDEKAPIRMGGVYTLVGLVDEWLEEKSLSDDERFKEGQVIINNLCAYIRSPFTLTSHYDELSQDSPTSEGIYKDKKEEFYIDKAILDSEADVRLSIIKEIHDRIQGPDKNTPGAWSDFEYDFSGSTFFYPIDLTNSYYAKPINFSGSTYQGGANFSDSTYRDEAYFGGSTYQGGANFSDSTYKDVADFGGSTYQGRADFSRSTYQWASFIGSTYQGWAYFSDSTYKSWAYFTDSTYQWASFNDSTYKSWAYFSDSTYENETNFSGSIFYQETYFGEDGYSNSSSCFTNRAPQFYDKKKRKNTLFGSPNNDFAVDIDKGYPIDLDSKGIPLNCKFLTSEQKEYLEGKLQEIEKINNKLFEVKDLAKKTELLKKLRSLYKELRKWREKVTTVKVEDVVAEDTKS
ncbi:pentapeptide repeat-containing protein [Rothia dentocariosa]|uniref:pentapeptide repeat-containing protein n=1 Tax=Rothia dentocariosa TaxID=2047 RepID=UPI0001E06D3C|nr:pentapeptide repeat-containing protein [Rothia dentocariosa]EFJ77937.1 hypothetical protein HMPREF0734_00987 [Rothia dentocariosa M567]